MSADPPSKPSSATSSTPSDSLTLAELQKQLGASHDGLSQEEAQSRLVHYGRNELPEEKTNVVLKFLSYFWGPIPWMIEIAAVLSAMVNHWADFTIITTLLVVNALIGFWEEFQAGNAIAALKEKLALRAKARRDGAWRNVPAQELVPGDVIRLRIGDIVPADAKLLDGESIHVDQSALTGESLPVTRNVGEDVYSGSVVKQGEIEALVYGTGQNTFFGKTAHLMQGAQAPSHFQRAVLKIGNFLIGVAVALVSLILIVALFRGDPIMTTLQFALVLTVAAVPVALPTVLSVTMAVGAKLLARYQAIVSRLAAIEELAGMDVLCSDKTGTLTQNKLTLGEPFCVNGTAAQAAILSAALASREEDQDAIDLAVIGGLKSPQDRDAYNVVHFQPFDPVGKRTEATVRSPDGSEFKVSKGAPQVILALAANADAVRESVDGAIDEFARRGFRALGVARTDAQGRWQFQGVLPLYDPPRADSKATIEQARQMGAKVKMVTGDQLAIAKETSRELGLGPNILDASLFSDTEHHQAAQLDDEIEKADGFAQVYPEHKYHVVDVLQKRGHVVGMTGDGVNDAPALKKAEAGIAVSGATDAARAAADIVLLSPGLSVITKAMTESRKIFQRMTNYATYRIAETIRVLLFMTLSILVFNFYPVTAVMIVLLALLNDGAIISIAFDRVRYSKKPVVWDMKRVLSLATVLGVAGVIESFGLYYMAEHQVELTWLAWLPSLKDYTTTDAVARDSMIRTLVYLKLSVAGTLTIYVTRTRGRFWTVAPAWPLFLAVSGAQLTATVVASFGIFMAPLPWEWVAVVWAYALAGFLIEDELKLITLRLLEAPHALFTPRRMRRRWAA
ncbi:MAG: plasma-membrane proton-efflux P-type ATPase [Pirellulales bacterium]|nr:plasma-membrane proton-efflux P-type ATPase [Pirellulales bacterium]